MNKKIAIILYAENAINIKKLVEYSLSNALNSSSIQFIFFIQPENESCKDMACKLYMEYPPVLFSEDKQPTIKVVCKQNNTDWIKDCVGRANADIVISLDTNYSLNELFAPEWDMSILRNKIPPFFIIQKINENADQA